jgi:hypothetical protein
VNRGNGHTGADVIEPAATIVYASHRTGEGTTSKPRRATGPQMKHGECLAVKRAEAAVFIKNAKQVTLREAVKSTGSNLRYAQAWETLEQSGDVQLMENARAGCISPPKAAAMVKPLVALKTAFKAAKAVNPASAIAFFTHPEVKSFIAGGGVITTEEHMKATLDALGGVDGVLNALATLDATKPQSKEVGSNGHG